MLNINVPVHWSQGVLSQLMIRRPEMKKQRILKATVFTMPMLLGI